MNFPSVDIKNQTSGKVPDINFEKIKNAVLGKKYELSVVFLTPIQILKLNKKYRNKACSTDILSFSIESDFGEIFLCPRAIRKKAKTYGRLYDNLTAFLFIHGLYHLKGLRHSSKMESKELHTRKIFGI